jgi:hypothetical protein
MAIYNFAIRITAPMGNAVNAKFKDPNQNINTELLLFTRKNGTQKDVFNIRKIAYLP